MPPAGTVSGDMLYWNGSQWIALPAGGYGKTLFMCNGVPAWGGCVPLVATTAVSEVRNIYAVCGGNVTNEGGVSGYTRGLCWSTLPNPTINLSTKTSENVTGTGSFTHTMTGLSQGTTYYMRAYASNTIGTTYGEEKNAYYPHRIYPGTIARRRKSVLC